MTVTEVVETIPPRVAVMVTGPPGFTPSTSPVTPVCAIAGFAEVQLTRPVKIWVEPSLKVAVAMNGCIDPRMIEESAGVTAIDCSAAPVTVSTVEPVTPLRVALTVLVPPPNPVATPAAVMDATEPFAEFQITRLVRF